MGQFPAQTEDFSITWDATPTQAPEDVVMGLSNGPAKKYSDMACIIRFSDTGDIDARNGANYAASSKVTYKTGVTYFFRACVRTLTKSYDVFVKFPGQPEIVLASDFAFRSEQANVIQLNTLDKILLKGDATLANMSSPQPLLGPPSTDVPVPIPPDPPIPPGPSDGFPDASNTGVPPGISLRPSGSITVSQPNSVIEALDVTGTITIASGAGGTIIRNCKIRYSGSVRSAIDNSSQAPNITVKNCTIIGPGLNDTLTGSPTTNYGIWNVNNGLIEACDISEIGQPINMGVAKGLIIRGNYIHDLHTKPADDTHFEAIYIGGTDGRVDALLIENNRLENHNGVTAALFMKNDFGALQNITVQNNLLDDGANGVNGYTTYCQEQAANRPTKNVKYLNNALVKGHYGYIYNGTGWNGLTWQGNYDYKTSAPVTSEARSFPADPQ